MLQGELIEEEDEIVSFSLLFLKILVLVLKQMEGMFGSKRTRKA